MSAWTTVGCLLQLRTEFNSINPKRDKGADGTIGDTSHSSSSDHTPDEDSRVLRDHDADSKNEVHALDIDSSGPWDGKSFNTLVHRVISSERAKWLSQNDRCRLKYVIYNRKIYAQSTDFEPRTYIGSDPHTNHAHFSARYETSCENDTRSFGVEITAPPAPNTAKEWDEMASQAEVQQAARNAFLEILWDGYHAAMADSVYNDASDADKKIMRNARDTVAGIVSYAVREEFEALMARLPVPPTTSS